METLNQLATGFNLVKQVARWALGKPSILATAPSHVHIFWKSFEGLDEPDLQGVFTPGSYAEGKVYVLDDYPGCTAGAWQHRPESTGWVRAKTADVFDDPEIQPNYLSDRDGPARASGRHPADPPAAEHALDAEPLLTKGVLPGVNVERDDELLDFAYRNGSTTYHLIGTAGWGRRRDLDAVSSTTGCRCMGWRGCG